MGDLSAHFGLWEFRCPDGCGRTRPVQELVTVLEYVRSHFGGVYGVVRIDVVSGCRCPNRNKAVGGSPWSQHMYYRAADFHVMYKLSRDLWGQVDTAEVDAYLRSEYPGKYGIGVYTTWNHIDVRRKEARWDER